MGRTAGRGAQPASLTALLLGWGECLGGGRKPECPAPAPCMVLRSFGGFQCRAHSACPRTWQGQIVNLGQDLIASYKTRISPFPFPKSHHPAPGGWTSPSSLPQRFTMYPMAWSHRRDTQWEHPTGAQALGAHNTPIPCSPDQSSTGLGQLKRD